ncbi:MAG: 4-amino-4-deoxychorismate lyase [Eubacteriaceae bacterium]|nr:4-amino-4-deoxychorismate lyase [Eubacteriaceae bacterium]
MYVSVQGKIQKSSEFFISPYSEGLMYGAGLFETLKYEGERIYFLSEHMERLRGSAGKLNMVLKYSDNEIERFLKDMISFHEVQGGVLKINLIKDIDEDILVISRRENTYVPEIYHRGFNLCVSDYRRNQHSLLIGMKTDNYLENILEFRKAKCQGFDEVIFLNTKDKIAECSLSNIFFIKDGRLKTPSVDCGILKGIMRDKILDLATKFGIMVDEGEFEIEELFHADEIFISNSVMEIMPVLRIRDRFSKEVPGKVTEELSNKFINEYKGS